MFYSTKANPKIGTIEMVKNDFDTNDDVEFVAIEESAMCIVSLFKIIIFICDLL